MRMRNLTKAQRLMKEWHKRNVSDSYSFSEWKVVDKELKDWLIHLALHDRLFIKTNKGEVININSDFIKEVEE